MNIRTMLLLAGVLSLVSNPCALAHTDVTVEEARDLIASKSDLTVVDVREPYEYCDARGHIPGALNYPWSSGVLRARYEELPADGPVLVVCRSGGRSNAAASFLDSKGFSEVYDMLRGMNAWQWETAPCKYSGGSGTAEDPYQIATAADLIALGELPEDYDKHFILTADIDLDPNLPGRKVFDRAVIAPDMNDATWDFDGTPFTGVFKGNGYTISNLTIEGHGYLGLFGQLDSGATVSNIGLEEVDVHGTGGSVGGLAGINWGTITSSYSTGMVAGRGSVGGLVGQNYEGTITSSYSSGTASGTGWDVGGLVGQNTGSISESYARGSASGSDSVGGLVGCNYVRQDAQFPPPCGTVACCYSTGMVSGDRFVGGLVGDDGGFDCVTNSFWDVETSGLAASSGERGKTTAEMQNPNTFMQAGWDFVAQPDGPSDIWAEPVGGGYPILWWQLSSLPKLPAFSGGAGEPENPYLLSSTDDLNRIGYNPRLMGAHFRLTNDIDLAGVDFFMIGYRPFPFAGVFDGNGHTISNFSYTSVDRGPVGLFGSIASRGTIKNLRLIDPNVDGGVVSAQSWHDYYYTYSCGSLVGSNGGTITNCRVEGGRISGSGSLRGKVGGLVGYNGGTITSSYSTGSVSGDDYVGGLVGSNSGNIIGSYSTGTVTGDSDVGGLVGSNHGGITASYSTSTVSGTERWGNRVGGLVGNNWFGNITASGDHSVGGLVGSNCDGNITASYSTGTVIGVDCVGGLAGINVSGVVIHSYSAGAVGGTLSVGGLVGRNAPDEVPFPLPGIITDSFWDSQTSGQRGSAGGFGKATAEMQTASTFLEAGWDFVGETTNGTDDIWWILEGQDYPRLWWEVIAEN